MQSAQVMPKGAEAERIPPLPLTPGSAEQHAPIGPAPIPAPVYGHGPAPVSPRPPARPRGRGRGKLLLAGVVGLGVLLFIALSGIFAREHHEAALVRATNRDAVPWVDTITTKVGVKPRPLTLPGEIQAYFAAPIYGQVSGYVKMWYKDIGARVTKGETLATIETPGLDQQLEQAKAALAEAVANEKLAAVTATRWRKLLSSQSVSQQETDVKTADMAAQEAKVQAAQANVSRLEAMESFKHLVAPFDGVVTARKVDVGQLVTADKTSEPELFEVSRINPVRIYVKVPQTYVADITPGMHAELHLPEYPDKTFHAKLITVASGVNPISRTELVELLADNPKDELIPGAYTEVHFELPPSKHAIRIPTSALIFQEHGLQVAVLGPHDRIELHDVQVGVDLGTEVEIVSGLAPGDQVVNSPPATLVQGERVRIANPPSPAGSVAQAGPRSEKDAKSE